MEQNSETDISSEQKKEESSVWVPRPDGNTWRKKNPQKKTATRAFQTDPCMIPSPFLFPKSKRVLKRKHFIKIAKQGEKKGGTFLLFQSIPHPYGPKIGLTVSRKHGKAVLRNRFKRRLRDLFRHSDLKAPVAFVVTSCSPKTLRVSFEKIKKEFDQFTSFLKGV